MSSNTFSTTPELTFGVEIEGILAFHESHLSKHLGAKTIIHKDLTPEVERGLRSTRYTQNPYRSWAFGEEGTDQPLRKYGTEALSIAKELRDWHFAHKNASVPEVRICADKEDADYSTWQLMSDLSLVALDKEQKSQYGLRGENWDSHGIELVSKPYLLSDLPVAQSDITALVASLTTDTSAITTNESCGLHVHIGLPKGELFPIEVLRNLALLTIAYENHISLLHPERRSNGSSSDLHSNKSDTFYTEDDTLRDQTTRNGQVMQSTALAFERIRNLIMAADHAELAKIMGDRKNSTAYGFVDWSRIHGGCGPATFEFRQHAGTLQAEEIGHWVHFCAGLVQLAYSYARNGEQPLAGMGSWDCALNLVLLMKEMVDKDCLVRAEGTAEYYAHKYETALEGGRDPEEELWQEKFDDDWDAPLSDNDSGLALGSLDEVDTQPLNSVKGNSGIWEGYCQ